MLRELRHLTWSGRLEAVWYALRRLFVAPIAEEDRCFMGAPIGEHIHCPHRAVINEPWCRRHMPKYEADISTIGDGHG